MIELNNFSIGYNHRKLLNDVTANFPQGKLTSLIGRNGTGKSTLLRALCGLNYSYEGEIIINCENLRNISRKKLASLIAYVNTQRPRMDNLKCRDVVALGRSPYTNWYGGLSSEDKEEITKAMAKVGMLEFENRSFNSLSDGESQKVMIARAIVQNTNIILLDEPTSFLDLPTRYELANILKQLTLQENKTIIFSTHELDIALRFSDYVALIDKGELYILPASEMKESALLRSTFPDLPVF